MRINQSVVILRAVSCYRVVLATTAADHSITTLRPTALSLHHASPANARCRHASVRPGGAARRRRPVRLCGRAHLRVSVASGAPEEPPLARRTLVLRLRVHLHVLAEVARLVELLAAHLAREAARRRPVRVRVRDEVPEIAERGVALQTAQCDVTAGASRPVLRLVV